MQFKFQILGSNPYRRPFTNDNFVYEVKVMDSVDLESDEDVKILPKVEKVEIPESEDEIIVKKEPTTPKAYLIEEKCITISDEETEADKKWKEKLSQGRPEHIKNHEDPSVSFVENMVAPFDEFDTNNMPSMTPVVITLKRLSVDDVASFFIQLSKDKQELEDERKSRQSQEYFKRPKISATAAIKKMVDPDSSSDDEPSCDEPKAKIMKYSDKTSRPVGTITTQRKSTFNALPEKSLPSAGPKKLAQIPRFKGVMQRVQSIIDSDSSVEFKERYDKAASSLKKFPKRRQTICYDPQPAKPFVQHSIVLKRKQPPSRRKSVCQSPRDDEDMFAKAAKLRNLKMPARRYSVTEQSFEEKEKIRNERKEKLRLLAEEKKQPEKQNSKQEQPQEVDITKTKVKITASNRSDMLLETIQRSASTLTNPIRIQRRDSVSKKPINQTLTESSCVTKAVVLAGISRFSKNHFKPILLNNNCLDYYESKEAYKENAQFEYQKVTHEDQLNKPETVKTANLSSGIGYYQQISTQILNPKCDALKSILKPPFAPRQNNKNVEFSQKVDVREFDTAEPLNNPESSQDQCGTSKKDDVMELENLFKRGTMQPFDTEPGTSSACNYRSHDDLEPLSRLSNLDSALIAPCQTLRNEFIRVDNVDDILDGLDSFSISQNSSPSSIDQQSDSSSVTVSEKTISAVSQPSSNINDALGKILRWDTNLLDSPCQDCPASSMANSCENFEEYRQNLNSIIVAKLKYKVSNSSRLPSEHLTVKNIKERNSGITITTILPDFTKYIYKYGALLLVKMKNLQTMADEKFFGYISYYRDDLPQHEPFISIELYADYQQFKDVSVIESTFICGILQEMMSLKVLEKLEANDFVKTLNDLNRNHPLMAVPPEISQQISNCGIPLDELQVKVVGKIYNEVFSSFSTPGMFSVVADRNSDKSSVIAAAVLYLMIKCKSNSPGILICAETVASLDEIAKKLHPFVEQLKDKVIYCEKLSVSCFSLQHQTNAACRIGTGDYKMNEKNLIKNAKVVLTTLENCHKLILHEKSFMLSIIDNATELQDVDIIVPFTMTCRKMVLFGEQQEQHSTSLFHRLSAVSTKKNNQIFKPSVNLCSIVSPVSYPASKI